ncbi:hypothetical protein [Thiolapillus sp.]|uniref:hypothetical protein n=1 Tax=Thiolapillus sp. TaxID=2017437 RepID=UPI003AF6C8AE
MVHILPSGEAAPHMQSVPGVFLLESAEKKNQNIKSVTCSTISAKTINYSINKLLNKMPSDLPKLK